MQRVEVLHTEMQQRDWCSLAAAGEQSQADRDEEAQTRNQRFVHLLNAFRENGGLARASEVSSQFQRRSQQDISVLGGWLVRREAIAFEWESRLWLPLFQFNLSDLSLRSGLAGILAELVVVYNDWDLASWFVQPNPWLAEGLPVDALALAAPQVLLAARAERSAAAANRRMTF